MSLALVIVNAACVAWAAYCIYATRRDRRAFAARNGSEAGR